MIMEDRRLPIDIHDSPVSDIPNACSKFGLLNMVFRIVFGGAHATKQIGMVKNSLGESMVIR